jgi:hypothetical protein
MLTLSASSISTATTTTTSSSSLSSSSAAFQLPLASEAQTPPEGYVWYFAIGSMTNPISLSLREIKPAKSFPAQLVGWDISFDSPAGMADIRPNENGGNSLSRWHGVCHLLSVEHMAKLDVIESAYKRRDVCVRSYDDYEAITCMGSNSHNPNNACSSSSNKSNVECVDGLPLRAIYVKATAYQMTNSTTKLFPEERYIKLITDGCRHFGVDSNYVSKVLGKVPFRPRKLRSEFLRFDLSGLTDQDTIKESELKQMDGSNPALGLAFSVDGIVCKYVHDCDVAKDPEIGPVINMFKARDITLWSTRMLFDAFYGIPANLDAMSDEHKASLVDRVLSMPWMKSGKFKVVARLIRGQ